MLTGPKIPSFGISLISLDFQRCFILSRLIFEACQVKKLNSRNGVNKMTYEGEYKKQGLVDFMRDPHAVPVKPKEEVWSESENDVLHLTDENFVETLAGADSALVMFYAPWCGHCKRMKPDYEKAAAILKVSF